MCTAESGFGKILLMQAQKNELEMKGSLLF